MSIFSSTSSWTGQCSGSNQSPINLSQSFAKPCEQLCELVFDDAYISQANVIVSDEGLILQSNTNLGSCKYNGDGYTCQTLLVNHPSHHTIENIQADDINSMTFIDVSGVVRSYPFTSAGSLLFNTNLQNDPSARYWMYFTSVPGGNFGDGDAIIVNDADDLPITGAVGGVPSRSFTFNYDSNNQGSRTPQTDADVTVVGIGLTGAQYVVTTSTIGRSVANNISVISVLERNYSNL